LSIVDARTLGSAAVEADVCVVGAGAAGITLATELARAGRDVHLVEGGDLAPDEETQTLHDLESVGQPVRPDFMSRARYYGGTCNLWAGRCMRLEPFDLAPRSWVPHSGWPLSAEELNADLPAAGRYLGLPDTALFDAADPRTRLSADESELLGRDGLEPRVALWARRPMRFGPRHRRAIERSDRIRLLLNANATGLGLHADGRRVEALRIGILGGSAFEVRARDFVLTSGGLENARLLLVSRDVHSNGVGNAHDVVGRYFMDHPRAIHGRVTIERPARFPHLKGLPLADGSIQLGVGVPHAAQEQYGILNHYATFETEHSDYTEKSYRSFVETMKVLLRKGYAGKRTDVGRAKLGKVPELIYLLTPRELMPHPLYRFLHAAKRTLVPGKASQRRVVVYFCEQPPNPDSRVTLSDERDALGVNRLVLDWRLGDEVTRSLAFLQDHLARELAEAGAGKLEPGEGEPDYTDASHHMGTTRMSDDPRTGVVDRDGRVHGVENLFCASSSVFPSAGHSNPTLTIVALAVRLARHLAGR
jgi:choline dehydrogenase-like flavoprotein